MERFSPKPSTAFFTMSVTTILSFLVLLCVPIFAHAASTSFLGPIIPPACNCISDINGITSSSAPGWGCILATFQNFMSFAVGFACIIITLFIALAGFTYMTSGGSAEKRQLANKRIMNAIIGLLIVLCAYLLVDSIMKVIYNPNAAGFGPWNSILGGQPGQDCLAIRQAPNALPSLNPANNANASGGSAGSVGPATVSATGVGACNANTIQTAVSSGGGQISANDANTLACLAKFESNCGAVNQNYNWGKGSSAYGPFQLTLQGNAQYFNNPTCEAAAGVSGPLNCQSGFSGGNPIPGSAIAANCEKAAANLGCSAVAASQLYDAHGISPWTADANATNQGSCGQ